MADATIFARWCEIVLKEGRDKRVILFVDQFEEVFTQISNEAERVAFLNLLTHAATVENGRVTILFSMRSDFLSNCATYPQLNTLLNQQFIQIGAMQPAELVSAIAQPALRVGLRIDPDLVAQIINDMKGEPGVLPLVEFALKDLFDTKQAKQGIIALTREAYFERGGIDEALQRHADAAFAKLRGNEQDLACTIFSGLIEIGRGTQDTRRTVLFDDLIPVGVNAEDVKATLQKLADARLITTDESDSNKYTITHEKLIDAWPWLKKLVNENRDVIALQNEIASDAKEWEDHEHDSSYLYIGARLANAREKLEANKLVLGGLAYEFVKAGQAQQRRSQRTRTLGATIPIGLVILAIIVVSYIVTTNSTNMAKQNEAFGKTQEAAASTSQAIAVISQANEKEAQMQRNNALARQLAPEAELQYEDIHISLGTLLAVQSAKLFPTDSAVSFLINNYGTAPVMTHDDKVNSVAFSPDGKYVVSGSDDGTARVWEATSGQEVARMTHDNKVNSVAFSPDGKHVASGSDDGTARVWEAATGQEVARMTHAHDNSVYSVAFSPDGKYVVSGSDDGTARVWEATTGQEVARTMNEVDTAPRLSSVAFSLDGKNVVSNGGTTLVWEATTGAEVAHMTARYGILLFSPTFSPDGKYVVSGSSYGALVWEVATGKEIANVHFNDNDPVTSVAFSPDGKYVVSGGDDKYVRVWKWQADGLIAAACKQMSRNLSRAEWNQYIGAALPYQAVCENLPIEPEVTTTPTATP